MLLQICRHSDRSRFYNRICTMSEGPMTSEFRAAGVQSESGHDAFLALARHSDIVNLHVGGGNLYEHMLPLVKTSRLPFVMTVHDQVRLPVQRTLVICTSRNVLALQPDPHRCVVIHNGVDTSRFYNVPKSVSNTIELIRVCRP